MNFFKNLIKPKEKEDQRRYFYISELYGYLHKNLVRERIKYKHASNLIFRDDDLYFSIEMYENAIEPRRHLHTIYISRGADIYFADANGIRYEPNTVGGYLDKKCLTYFQKTRTAIKNLTPNLPDSLIF